MRSKKEQSIMPLGASFRDPSGFAFEFGGRIYRQVSSIYRDEYDHLLSSGLYDRLVDEGLLIPHKEVILNGDQSSKTYKTLQPRQIRFVSYPYEWCFSQLKDAALLTLEIERIALEYGMSLKDASSFNIQFEGYRPVFIDTLSFERLRVGKPWSAYKQFCQHFLAPLALISYVDGGLSQLLRSQMDGISLNLASKLLPATSFLRPGLLSNLHLQAFYEKKLDQETIPWKRKSVFKRDSFNGLLDHLRSSVEKLKWATRLKGWSQYYGDVSTEYIEQKKRNVAEFIEKIKPKTTVDVGANVGVFSRIAASHGVFTVSLDSDPVSVELNYLQCKSENEEQLLPLLMDLTNPSPSLGWHLRERFSLIERAKSDLTLVLGLAHHLCISSNIPLNLVASFFAELSKYLIVEFIPKNDPGAKKLLRVREDIFDSYSEDNFISEFRQHFVILKSVDLMGSNRKLFLMRNKRNA